MIYRSIWRKKTYEPNMFYPVKGAFPTKIDSNWSEVFFAAPMLRKLNINEDRQTGLTVHGGEDKAMYTYPKKDQEYRNYRSEYYEL
jgi:MOSC domain-containing protein YiiM